jgi:CheY-like chemotaxis protein
MDLRMPVMDGLEATRRIRALERADAKSVPIIALSANAYDSDVQNSLKAGMNSHLAKPADSELLYRELSKWIRRSIREEAAD